MPAKRSEMESNKSLNCRIATGVICWSTTFVMGANDFE